MQPQNNTADFDRLSHDINGLRQHFSSAQPASDHKPFEALHHRLDDLRLAFENGRFGEVAQLIKSISDRLDHLQPQNNTADFDRLRHDINGLRQQFSNTQRASDQTPFEALHHRLNQIQSLFVDPSETTGVIRTLANRIDALAEKILSLNAPSPTQHMIAELRERVEDLASHPPAADSFSDVEKRLIQLVERIERSTVNAVPNDHLKAVDQRLTRLAELMETRQTVPDNFARIERDLQETLKRLDQASSRGVSADQTQLAQTIEKHIVETRRSTEGTERRMTETLGSVHDALARLAARLDQQPERMMAAPVEKPAASKPGAAMAPAMAIDMPLDERQPKQRAATPSKPAVPASNKPIVEREKNPLSAAREAAARAVEVQRTQLDSNELDLPLEPGSGHPNGRNVNRGPSRTPADLITQPITTRPLDAVRAARAAMQTQHEAQPGQSKAATIRSSFIAAVRRATSGKLAKKDGMAETLAAKPALDKKPAAKPDMVVAKKPPSKLIKTAPSIGVGLAVLIVIMSAVRIVLSLGQSGGEALNVPNPNDNKTIEQPNNTSSLSLEPLGSTKTGFEPGRTGGSETFLVDRDLKTNAIANDAAAQPKIPPLPEGITSQRLKLALEAGNSRALFDVGLRLAEGRGVQRDLEASLVWFKLAADQGYAPAYYRVANIYDKGLGPKRDLKQAVSAYHKAAELGHRKSMHNLATLYASGAVTGTPDYERAVPLFEQAAELGLGDSQFNLAVLIVNGLGTKTNLGEAYKWFTVASQNGDKEASKKRDEIAARLAGQALVDARLAAQNFRAKPVLASANEEQAQTFLFEDNPLPGASANQPAATPNLGIAVGATSRRS